MPYGQVSRLAAVSRLKGEGTSEKIREHLTDDHAFGNEIAQTDDSVIVEATRTSAFPHNKQTKSWFVLGAPNTSLYARSRSTIRSY